MKGTGLSAIIIGILLASWVAIFKQTVLATRETTPMVKVKKTANTFFDRTWNWTIDNTADHSELILSVGEELVVNYAINIDADQIDSGYKVEGEIIVYNQTGTSIAIANITDVLSPEIEVDISCPFTLPLELPNNWTTKNCVYTATLPDGTRRVNTAFVNLLDGRIFSSTAQVLFGTPTSETDECVKVSDSHEGFLGDVCSEADVKIFKYARTIGPYNVCGEYTIKNTAWFKAVDSETTGQDSWVVGVTVPCDE